MSLPGASTSPPPFRSDGCNCVYVGDQAAYQRFQQLAIKQRLVQEQVMAAEMNEDAAMNWGVWGGFW
jgi:hypothetical protein